MFDCMACSCTSCLVSCKARRSVIFHALATISLVERRRRSTRCTVSVSETQFQFACSKKLIRSTVTHRHWQESGPLIVVFNDSLPQAAAACGCVQNLDLTGVHVGTPCLCLLPWLSDWKGSMARQGLLDCMRVATQGSQLRVDLHARDCRSQPTSCSEHQICVNN